MDSYPKPSDFVFSNRLLVGKIMDFYQFETDPNSEYEEEPWDPAETAELFVEKLEDFSKTRFFIKLRTLSRAFNAVVLQRFRKEYEILKVSVYQKNYQGTDVRKIKLNSSLVLFERGWFYLNFLIKIAKVKVCNLIIDEVDDISSENKNILHEKLHELLYRNRGYMNKFVGMKQLCEEGCDDCEYIADRCQEYGPLQLRVLLSDTKRHFKKCVNFDHDIASLAINISKCSESREECLEMTEQMFDSNVTCDELVLNLLEVSFISSQYSFNPDIKCYLPWELVQIMMKNWKVKTVSVNLSNFDRCFKTRWGDVGYFTGFIWKFPRINDPRLVSDVRLQNVRIGLEASYNLADFLLNSDSETNGDPASNCFSSARRMFPSEKYQIVLPQAVSSENAIDWNLFDDTTEIIHKTFPLIWKDDPTDLNLDVAMFSYYGDSTDPIKPFFQGRKLTVTETEWSERVAQFPPGYPFESFDVKKGYSIRVEDPINNCVINYDVFVF